MKRAKINENMVKMIKKYIGKNNEHILSISSPFLYLHFKSEIHVRNGLLAYIYIYLILCFILRYFDCKISYGFIC